MPPTAGPPAAQSDVSSNTVEGVNEKGWPSSTSPTAAVDDEELPPWLAHVVKGDESGAPSRSKTTMSYSFALPVLLKWLDLI